MGKGKAKPDAPVFKPRGSNTSSSSKDNNNSEGKRNNSNGRKASTSASATSSPGNSLMSVGSKDSKDNSNDNRNSNVESEDISRGRMVSARRGSASTTASAGSTMFANVRSSMNAGLVSMSDKANRFRNRSSSSSSSASLSASASAHGGAWRAWNTGSSKGPRKSAMENKSYKVKERRKPPLSGTKPPASPHGSSLASSDGTGVQDVTPTSRSKSESKSKVKSKQTETHGQQQNQESETSTDSESATDPDSVSLTNYSTVCSHNFFLSHSQLPGGDQMQALQAELRRTYKKSEVWYDNSRDEELIGKNMVAGVKDSAVFVLFLTVQPIPEREETETCFERKFVQLELRTAVESKKPIIFLHEEKTHKFGTELARFNDYIKNHVSPIESEYDVIPFKRYGDERKAMIRRMVEFHNRIFPKLYLEPVPRVPVDESKTVFILSEASSRSLHSSIDQALALSYELGDEEGARGRNGLGACVACEQGYPSESQLRCAKALVVMVTPSVLSSLPLRNALETARKEEIPVVPVDEVDTRKIDGPVLRWKDVVEQNQHIGPQVKEYLLCHKSVEYERREPFRDTMLRKIRATTGLSGQMLQYPRAFAMDPDFFLGPPEWKSFVSAEEVTKIINEWHPFTRNIVIQLAPDHCHCGPFCRIFKESLEAPRKTTRIGAFHVFSSWDWVSGDTRSVLKSLANQMCSTIPEYREALSSNLGGQPCSENVVRECNTETLFQIFFKEVLHEKAISEEVESQGLRFVLMLGGVDQSWLNDDDTGGAMNPLLDLFEIDDHYTTSPVLPLWMKLAIVRSTAPAPTDDCTVIKLELDGGNQAYSEELFKAFPVARSPLPISLDEKRNLVQENDFLVHSKCMFPPSPFKSHSAQSEEFMDQTNKELHEKMVERCKNLNDAKEYTLSHGIFHSLFARGAEGVETFFEKNIKPRFNEWSQLDKEWLLSDITRIRQDVNLEVKGLDPVEAFITASLQLQNDKPSSTRQNSTLPREVIRKGSKERKSELVVIIHDPKKASHHAVELERALKNQGVHAIAPSEKAMHGLEKKATHAVIICTEGVVDASRKLISSRRHFSNFVVLWDAEKNEEKKQGYISLFSSLSMLELVSGEIIDWFDPLRNPQQFRQNVHNICRRLQLESLGLPVSEIGGDPAQLAFEKAKEYGYESRKCLIESIENKIENSTSQRRNVVGTNAFLLVAAAGTGKSVILGEVCRRGFKGGEAWMPGRPQAQTYQVVVVHFFRHCDTRRSSVKAFLFSVLTQLCAAFPEFRTLFLEQRDKLVAQKPIEEHSLSTLFEFLLRDVLKRLKDKPPLPPVVVIDALDECNESDREEFLMELKKTILHAPDWLFFLLATRPEANVEQYLSEFVSADLRLESKENYEDLSRYIKTNLKKQLGNDTDPEELAKRILNASGGLFLYIKFILGRMQSIPHSDQSGLLEHARFSDLPRGISAVFKEYFSRIRSRVASRENYRTILGPIVIARDQLPVELWRRCFPDDDETGNNNKAFKRFVSRRARESRSPTKSNYENAVQLVTVRSIATSADSQQQLSRKKAKTGEYEVISMLHKSMVEWLCNKKDSKGLSAERDNAKLLHIERREAHSQLAKKCMEELEEAVGIASSSVTLSQRYAIDHGLWHAFCGQDGETPKLLGDQLSRFDLLLFRIMHGNISVILADLQLILQRVGNENLAIQVIAKAVVQAAPCLRRHPEQLAVQLIARLSRNNVSEELPDEVSSLAKDAEKYISHLKSRHIGAWLQPVATGLFSAFCGVFRSFPDGSAEVRARKSGILGVDIDPKDPTKVVTGLQSKTRNVVLWNAFTGACIAQLRTAQESVQSVRFHPSKSDQILTASGKAAFLWDVSNSEKNEEEKNRRLGKCKLLWALKYHEDIVNSASFDKYGLKVVVASKDCVATVWDVSKKKIDFVLQGHAKSVNSAEFHLSLDLKGRSVFKIVTSSSDCTIMVWDARTGQRIRRLGEEDEGHTQAVRYAKFSSDGSKIVSASSDKSVIMWGATAFYPKLKQYPHAQPVNFASFSQDCGKIISACEDGCSYVWNVCDASLLAKLSEHTRAVSCAFFMANSNTTALTVSRDNKMLMWDFQSSADLDDQGSISPCSSDAHEHSKPINSISFSPGDGAYFLTVADDFSAVWDTKSGDFIATLGEPGYCITSAQFFPKNAAKILTIVDDGRVMAWQLERNPRGISCDKLFELAENKGSVLVSKISAEEEFLVTAHENDGSVILWDLQANPQPERIVLLLREGYSLVKGCEFSPDGKLLIVIHENEGATVLEIPSGGEVRSFSKENLSMESAKFSPDQSLVVSTFFRYDPIVWDPRQDQHNQNPSCELHGHSGRIKFASFSPSRNGGYLIATASSDKTAKVFRKSETGEYKCIGTSEKHKTYVLRSLFSADATRLLTIDKKKQCRMWDVENPTDGTLKEVEFTIAEARKFRSEATPVIPVPITSGYVGFKDSVGFACDTQPDEAIMKGDHVLVRQGRHFHRLDVKEL